MDQACVYTALLSKPLWIGKLCSHFSWVALTLLAFLMLILCLLNICIVLNSFIIQFQESIAGFKKILAGMLIYV